MTGRSVEAVILQCSSRGMDLVANELPANYCHCAARALLDCPRGVVGIATGFYVAGAAETDGPPGANFLALGLRELGFDPVILTDRIGSGLFEPAGLSVIEVAVEPGGDQTVAYRKFVDHYRPVALVSVERCGRAADGEYKNMKGNRISEHTAPIDVWFDLARTHLTTIAIGDGGNEIGMGNIAQTIREHLRLDPCVVTVDHLIVATVSNWGAYGLLAALEQASGKVLLPTADDLRSYLSHIVEQGCVDGISGEPRMLVDGHDFGTESAIVVELAALRTRTLHEDMTLGQDRLVPASFPMSPDYEHKSWSQQDIGERVARRFGTWLHEQAESSGRPLPRSLLDIGCGPGNLTVHLSSWLRLPELNVTGIDIDPDMVARAQARAPSVSFAVGDMYSVGRSEKRFDAIYSNEVWHWMPRPPMRFRQRSEVLYTFFPENLKSTYMEWGHGQQRKSFAALARRLTPDGAAILQFGLCGQLETVYEMLEHSVRNCAALSPGLPFHLFYNSAAAVLDLVRDAGLEVFLFDTAVEDLAESDPSRFVEFVFGFAYTHIASVLGQDQAGRVFARLAKDASGPLAPSHVKGQWHRLVLGVRHKDRSSVA